MGTLTSLLNNDSLQAALQDKNLQAMLYQELRIIAHARLSDHAKNNELDTTSLVHEAFLKLNQNGSNRKWQDRRHFYATAALAMRHILVDFARKRLAEKRPQMTTYETINEADKQTSECSQMMALNDALEQLKVVDSELVEVVNLRYFVGLTVAETADILHTSKRSVNRAWQKAKALLSAFMNG